MKFAVFAAIAAALAIAVSGCTTVKSGGVTYDSMSRTTIVTGKETTISPLAGPVKTLFLKAEISPGETGLYLVVLYLSVNGWLSADKVWDSDGHRLEGLRGSEESFNVQNGKVTKEIYYIPLTRPYLEAHRKSGINIRLQGAKGSLTATQSGSSVSGFLTSFDAAKKKLNGEVTVKKLVPDHPKRPSRKPKVNQFN
ncbi:MAG: hypothetical protein JO025_26950 [Verrucomicrobia bacterium]|nr:hypothetical protein [Verrucomicrobiota bacterium]